MHNIVKYTIIALLATLLLTSCGRNVSINYIDKSYSTDTILADAKIPQISGLSSQSVQEEINGEYEKTITDLLGGFSKEAKETGDKSFFAVTTTLHRCGEGFFSAVTEIESAPVSNHKNSFRITKNIDTSSCCEVRLSDLFSDDGYIDMINARLDKTVQENPAQYADLWEKPRLSDNQKFYINEKNLVLFYAPYELSYYERGFVEIPLPLEEMSGYLKPEYRRLSEN